MGCFEIIAHLKTDKDAKYLGGIIQLDPDQLMKQQGENISVKLVKAIDENAICELRVDQINTEKRIQKISVDVERNVVEENGNNRENRDRLSPESKPEQISSPQKNTRTKSEFQYRLNTRREPEDEARYTHINKNRINNYSPNHNMKH